MASSSAAENDTLQPVKLLEARVQVVDAQGQPIAGAKVTPWARQCSNGHGTWQAGVYGGGGPPTVATNAEGQATIPYPEFALPTLGIRPDVLTCRVEHPDYADTVYNDLPVPQNPGNVDKFTLQRGGQVILTALDESFEPVSEGVFALWSDHSFWSSAERPAPDAAGKVKLPRIVAGEEVVRLVRLDGETPTHFSPALPLPVVDGESIELIESLTPAVTLRGRLSDNVPRPVQQGRVIASIVSASGNGSESIFWQTWAPVAEDGAFDLSGLPADEAIQIIALCEGFRAANGKPPEFATQRERERTRLQTPQVFQSPPAGEQEVVLPMEPTYQREFLVVDAQAAPLEGIEVQSWPNVHWWNGGNQMYGTPLMRSVRSLRQPKADVWREDEGRDRYDAPYTAKTDARGQALLKNLPKGLAGYLVSEGRDATHRYEQQEGRIEVAPDTAAQVKVVLELRDPSQ